MNEDLKKENLEQEEVQGSDSNVSSEEVHQKTKKEVKNKLKEENKRLAEQVASLKDELLRNRAELENFKKRMKDEAIKDRKYASLGLVSDIITPVDYLEKACNFQSDSPELNNFLIGFKMISNQIVDVLKADGLSEIEAKAGDEFDPNIHHAMEKEHQEGIEPNVILAVLAKGYKYKDRIIRPAMVKVSE